jgi:hypothetical protein
MTAYDDTSKGDSGSGVFLAGTSTVVGVDSSEALPLGSGPNSFAMYDANFVNTTLPNFAAAYPPTTALQPSINWISLGKQSHRLVKTVVSGITAFDFVAATDGGIYFRTRNTFDASPTTSFGNWVFVAWANEVSAVSDSWGSVWMALRGNDQNVWVVTHRRPAYSPTPPPRATRVRGGSNGQQDQEASAWGMATVA